VSTAKKEFFCFVSLFVTEKVKLRRWTFDENEILSKGKMDARRRNKARLVEVEKKGSSKVKVVVKKWLSWVRGRLG